MPILFNIAVSLIASAVIFVGGMNLPASNFSLKSLTDPVLGAFTEISTATNLADFPATYNANLNKTIEVGTTSVASITTLNSLTSASALATVGTITTGTWSADAIAVAKGGTGTTSPTSNQVMIGNGASGFKVIGFGSNGQFLTSGGAGTAPSWTTSALDQAGTYTWTGANMWTASTTHTATTSISASSVMNNALTLNGLSYAFPTSQTSGTVLKTDGSGVLTWGVPQQYNYVTTADVASSGTTNATTTVFTIPAGVMTASSTAQFIVTVSGSDSDGGSCSYELRTSAGATVAAIGSFSTLASFSDSLVGTSNFSLLSMSSLSSQTIVGSYIIQRTTSINAIVANYAGGIETTSALNFANAQSLVFVVIPNGATCNILNAHMIVNP